jgi:hypothetical protein
MDWPKTLRKAISGSHRIARRGKDAIVVTTDLPHIFECVGTKAAPIFEESPHYEIVYYNLARLARQADEAEAMREREQAAADCITGVLLDKK